jgi:hypothetical protein
LFTYILFKEVFQHVQFFAARSVLSQHVQFFAARSVHRSTFSSSQHVQFFRSTFSSFAARSVLLIGLMDALFGGAQEGANGAVCWAEGRGASIRTGNGKPVSPYTNPGHIYCL